MLTFKQVAAKNFINARGWRTKRKLLLIESDDWGAIRMPSRKTYDYFLSKNIQVDKSYFDKYDSLESEEDLESLFEILDSFRDINGNPAVITAFSVVANPDFEKIEADKRQKYHYELITDTYKRNPYTEKSFELFREGVKKKLFYPQFHGREHINVKRWMEAINSNSIKERLAIQQHAIISARMINDEYFYPLNYFAAFDYDEPNEQISYHQIISEGLRHFETLFGFKSLSFVAPCSIWSDYINEPLAKGYVKLQSGQQSLPIAKKNKLKIKSKIWGSKNQLGQVHWRRNCTFEPSRNQQYDWVKRCLEEIEIAFRWGKPAVINSHRVNFIGSIFPENRTQSLEKLKSLLVQVQKRWPDVEFIDTERLGNIMLTELVAQ
jgi:hypothetical protein